MEEQDELQMLIQLKKGIFHSQIRKKKIQIILSEKRRKDQQQNISCSNTSNQDRIQIQQSNHSIFDKLQQTQPFADNLNKLMQIFQSNNHQQIEELLNNNDFFSGILSMLSSIDLYNEKCVDEILFIITNITYYNKNEQFFQDLVNVLFINCYKSSIMAEEGSMQDSNNSLLQQIAIIYEDNIKMIEYLVSISNNLIFQENNYLFQVILFQEQQVSTMIAIFEQKQHSTSFQEDVIHLIYNISRQNEHYHFSQMDDYLYLIYLIFPLVSNTLQRNRLIHSLSFILETSSQQEFEDFITNNYQMFDFLFQFIDSSLKETQSIKDEESIQIILEIFLLASDILNDDNDSFESKCLKKIVWESSKSIFRTKLQNAEITILSLKIMQSIVQNNINDPYYVNNLLEKQQQSNEDDSFFALKQIILQSCEWNSQDIVNEFISLMHQLIINTNQLNQVSLLLSCGIIFIFLEALQVDFLCYEAKDEILKSFIYLLNLNDKFFLDEEQVQCQFTQKFIKIFILQHSGLQILENYLNQKITQNTQEMLQQILDELERDNIQE